MKCLAIIIIIIILSSFTTINTSNITYKLSDNNNNNNRNTWMVYQGKKIVINTYNSTKKLRTKIVTSYIQYYPQCKTIYFFYPYITIFNNKNIPIWIGTANQAILDQKKILTLHKYIYMQNLTNNKNFQSFITNHAIINLITYEIFSHSKVIINGYHFYSTGMQMYGNLYTQKIQLVNDTQICYEIIHTS